MRNLSLSCALLVAIAACGPSNKELSLAKQARYQGDKLVLFNAAKATAEAKHKIFKSDEAALGFQTVARWYTPEGMVSTGTDENMQDVPDRAIRLSLVVRVLPDGDKWVVQVEPSMVRRIAGSPQPQPLAPTDPSVPGWATGMADTLQFEIHEALKPYEVKSVGGLAPGPTAPAPAEAPSSEPAEAPSSEPAAPEAAPAPAP